MALGNPFGNDPFGFNNMMSLPGPNSRRRSLDFPSPAQNPYTLLQLLQIAELQKSKNRGASFLDKIKSGGGDLLTGALSLISRPGWAIAEGARRGLEGQGFELDDFLKGFSRGIQGKRTTGFGEVLAQESNWFDEHRKTAGFTGFGLDVVTDPLNLLLIAAAPVTGGTSLLPLVGKEVVKKGFGELGQRGVSKELLQAVRRTQSNEMFGSLDEADNILNMLNDDAWRTNKVLAQTKRDLQVEETLNVGGILDDLPDLTKRTEIASLQEKALLELERNIGPKRLQARVKVPFAKFGDEYETGIGRLNKGALNITPPLMKAPSLLRTARAENLLGKVPLVAASADVIGRTFKPGFGNEEYHAVEKSAKRTAEYLHRVYRRDNEQIFAPFVRGGSKELTPDEQLDALDWGEANKELVGGDRRLNEDVLENSGLSPKQQDFVKAWHRSTEGLRRRDRQFGIEYDKELEGLYIPHLYTKQGAVLPEDVNKRVAGILSKKGFQYQRKGATTIKGLRELAENDPLRKQIETDPITLLSARTRRGAQAHADKTLTRTIAKTEGVPSRVPDEAKLAKIAEEFDKVEQGYTTKAGRKISGLNDLDLLADGAIDAARNAVADVSQKRFNAEYQELTSKAARQTEEIEAEIKKLERSAKAQATRLSKKWPSRVQDVSVKSLREAGAPEHVIKSAIRAVLINGQAKKLRGRINKLSSFKARASKIGPDLGKTPHGSKYYKLLFQAARTFAKKPGSENVAQVARGKYPLHPLSKKRRPDGTYESWKSRLDDYLDDEMQLTREKYAARKKQAQDIWDAARAAQKSMPKKPRNYELEIARKRKAIDRIEETRSRKVAELNERINKSEQRLSDDLESAYEKQVKRGEQLRTRQEKLRKQTDRALTAMKNPNVPENYLEVKQLLMDGPGGKKVTVMVDAEIAKAMATSRRIVTDEEALKQFDTAFHKMVSRWKVLATVVNTGYAIRNALSDAWNMYLSGVPAWAMVRYSAAGARMEVRAERALNKQFKNLTAKEQQAVQMYMEAYHHGVLSGLYEGDIQQVAKYMKSGTRGTKDLAKDGHLLAAFTRMMSEGNRHRENMGRLTHYIYRREYEKLSPARASAEVKAAHFDYEDLTPFEQKLKRNVIPFYTWTRKNIPFQVKQLASRPGKYSAFPKFMNEMEWAAGGGEGDVLPDYMKKNMAFRVPFGEDTYLIPQIGAADLSKVSQALKGDVRPLLGMTNPFLKGAIELGTNRSLLSGAPIFGGTHERNPISDLGNLFRLLPGSNIGRTERSVGGKQVGGLGAAPWLTYLLGQVPSTNFAFNQMSDIRRAQRGGVGGVPGGALSYAGGFGVTDVDTEQALIVEQILFNEEMQRKLRSLRDENLLPESADESSPYEQQLLQMIQSARGRPRG